MIGLGDLLQRYQRDHFAEVSAFGDGLSSAMFRGVGNDNATVPKSVVREYRRRAGSLGEGSYQSSKAELRRGETSGRASAWRDEMRASAWGATKGRDEKAKVENEGEDQEPNRGSSGSSQNHQYLPLHSSALLNMYVDPLTVGPELGSDMVGRAHGFDASVYFEECGYATARHSVATPLLATIEMFVVAMHALKYKEPDYEFEDEKWFILLEIVGRAQGNYASASLTEEVPAMTTMNFMYSRRANDRSLGRTRSPRIDTKSLFPRRKRTCVSNLELPDLWSMLRYLKLPKCRCMQDRQFSENIATVKRQILIFGQSVSERKEIREMECCRLEILLILCHASIIDKLRSSSSLCALLLFALTLNLRRLTDILQR
ncbi:hypothetical protein LguiA_027629 [Lonicera macranthoides]